MVQHTRHAIQLRRRPLPVLEPDIWKPPDVRHDRQAEVDDEPPDGARDHLALEVGQSSEQAVQVAATVVVEDAYQADARARSHITQQAHNRDTVIGHDIIARVAGVAAPGPHIIGQRIAIILDSERTILVAQVVRQALQKPVAPPFRSRGGAANTIGMRRGIQDSDQYVIRAPRVQWNALVQQPDMPAKQRVPRRGHIQRWGWSWW